MISENPPSSSEAPPSPPTKPLFTPKSDWELLSQGAEARIWKIPAETFHCREGIAGSSNYQYIIAKERFSKAYRHAVLDEKLTKTRCRAEARILEKCLQQPASATKATRTTRQRVTTIDVDDYGENATGGLDVPKVLRVEAPVLYLEYVEGITIREYLEEELLAEAGQQQLPEDEHISRDEESDDDGDGIMTCQQQEPTPMPPGLRSLAKQVGEMVGRLHNLGIVHGDLTTSNMMLREQHKRFKQNNGSSPCSGDEDGRAEDKSSSRSSIALIDFGLAKSTSSAEERAVDLYVFERALSSTHPKLPPAFFPSVLKAYKPMLADQQKANAALQRLEQVRLRGRKRECFG